MKVKTSNISIVKKNANFKNMKKKEKSFFLTKKDKTTHYQNTHKKSLYAENEIGEVCKDIIDKYEDDLLHQRSKALLNNKTRNMPVKRSKVKVECIKIFYFS